MKDHAVVSRSEWNEARVGLLAREKELTRMRDELSAARRALPWVKVDKPYVFEAPAGRRTLAELFEGRSQLVVYHFMFGPEWAAGCKSCSFWADNFNGIVEHLAHRDVTLCAISRAPLAKLTAFAARLGWSFPWVSSHDSDFNFDFAVSFTPETVASEARVYNFGGSRAFNDEMPGISVFHRDAVGDVFHTYSCYARGLDMMNTAYHYLDLVPKGRDEERPMAWLRLRDEYGT